MRLLNIVIIATILLAGLGGVCLADEVGTGGVPAMKTLSPCPSSPNCVTTQTADSDKRMDPIPYNGSRESAQLMLRKIILALPRAEVTVEEPGYIAVLFRSRIFGFVDEVEFLFDEHLGRIHFRSGARTGYYDFGVNRSRMEEIVRSFRES